jgi:hypothetical protein
VACTVHWSQPYRWHKVSASHTAYLLPMFRLDSFLFFFEKGRTFSEPYLLDYMLWVFADLAWI